MNDKIWEVKISNELLEFFQVDKPIDFEDKAIQQPYNEFNGAYLGLRQYEAPYFYLRRDKKMPENSGLSYREWRLSQKGESMEGYNTCTSYPYSHGYAWEPSLFYKYNDKLYSRGASGL